MKKIIKRLSTFLLCGAIVLGDIAPVMAEGRFF